MATTTPGHRPDPWDRLPAETDPAWQAFVTYRDMGLERSLSKLALALHKSKPLVAGWSRKHSWQIRCSAWDREADKQWQRELAVARRKAAKRNIDLADAMKNLAAGSIVKLAQANAQLKPQDLARIMEVAAKLEALAMGSATEIHANATSAAPGASRDHVGVLSDEDRRARMLQLRREIDARLDDQGEPLGEEAS